MGDGSQKHHEHAPSKDLDEREDLRGQNHFDREWRWYVLTNLSGENMTHTFSRIMVR